MKNVEITYQATPNPESMKFLVGFAISSENLHFATAEEASRSPLAQKILNFPWASGVMIGSDFLTVSKHNWVEWQILADPLADLIKEHIESGFPVVSAEKGASTTAEEDPNDPPIVQKIKQILRDEIKPAVAMDGGDISFDRYEDGRVYLQMQGSCSGCPSSALTLKEGIETRLKEAIPEITEVISV